MHILHYLNARKKRKQQILVIDKLMMALAIIHPLTGLPQVITIYATQNAEGVSIVTWIGFLAIGALYLYYAILHSLKPLIVTQVLWSIIDVLIIVGVLIYR